MLCPYACHAFTCSRSQSVHSAMPSPVLAQIGDDLCVGVAHGDIFPAFVHIEIKIRQNVNFVDENHVAHLKHQGVLQWLIVPFGHG